MGSFDVSRIQNPAVAQVLYDQSEWSMRLARNDTEFERVKRFHDEVYGTSKDNEDEPEESRDNFVRIESAEYHVVCFSAISVDGILLGARTRRSGQETASTTVAFAIGSVETDSIAQWREAPLSRLPDKSGIEITIDAPDLPPTTGLALVEDDVTIDGLTLEEEERQRAARNCYLQATRVRIGNHAWQLLKPGYVCEPLQNTAELIERTPLARLRGIRVQPASPQVGGLSTNIIDNYS